MLRLLTLTCAAVLANPAWSDAPHMIAIQGGTFERGALAGERDERNTQQVTVSGFQIGKFEVTRWEFLTVMGEVPGAADTDLDLPVTQVSWRDAVAFANALSFREGLAPVYTITDGTVEVDWTADGYRLPTEAEWEFAARGGVESEGFLFSGSDELRLVGWFQDTASSPQPVGQLAPNELGLHDMSGNVWEWVWDVYAPYPDAAEIDPTGPETGARRGSRGGSFAYDPNRARTTNRSAELRHAPSPHAPDLGFRLARNL